MSSVDDNRKAFLPERRSFQANTTIFKEGDQADCAYIVEAGEVQIFKMVSGRRILLGDILPWGIFGELGLIDSSPRMATAVSRKDTVCMVISKASIGQMMDGAPQGLNTLIHSLVQVIRTAGQDLAEARYQLTERERH
ncbi:cyclic nucleotide-binding domain-containing protein [Telmatospirillum siberiense]|uniref:cAMP-binding protein n=1 Tax=Telmatospirillum siberiense TaxID=382514 RepID=A0A2N3PML4_9PROT|nr:cyclic nucleotide-binding domain-containing protein [Telmatospirillum siberiense]PKU21640.1 cAMP-binding protein [Telmatospirillum siberiense]